MQQRQQEAVSENKLALKVLASIGPKIKELEFKTANIAGMEFTFIVLKPLREAHLLEKRRISSSNGA